MKENEIWDLVEEAAERSHCKKRTVGCVLVDTNKNFVSMGWNYNPIDGDCEDKNNKTLEHVQHAEITAIQHIPKDFTGELVAYVNHGCCKNCFSELSRIVQYIIIKPQKYENLHVAH